MYTCNYKNSCRCPLILQAGISQWRIFIFQLKMEQCFGFCLSKLFSKYLAGKVILSTIISIYIDFLDDFANSWNFQGCSCTCISDSSL